MIHLINQQNFCLHETTAVVVDVMKKKEETREVEHYKQILNILPFEKIG